MSINSDSSRLKAQKHNLLCYVFELICLFSLKTTLYSAENTVYSQVSIL